MFILPLPLGLFLGIVELTLVLIKWLMRFSHSHELRHLITLSTRLYMLVIYVLALAYMLPAEQALFLMGIGVGLWALDELVNWIGYALLDRFNLWKWKRNLEKKWRPWS